MAEAFFNDLVTNEKPGEFTACSAGIATAAGCRQVKTQTVMKENYQIDVSSHNSRIVTDEDIDSVHLILTMTYNHKEYLLARFPSANGKTYTLGEYVENRENYSQTEGFERKYDIPDPYGMSKDVYSYCAVDIRKLVKKLIVRLLD